MVRISKKNLKLPKAPAGAPQLPSEAKRAALANDPVQEDTTHAEKEIVRYTQDKYPFLTDEQLCNHAPFEWPDINRAEKIKCYYDDPERYHRVVEMFPEQRHFRDTDRSGNKISSKDRKISP